MCFLSHLNTVLILGLAFKELNLLETKVNRLAGMLSDVIEATKMNVERKMARTAQVRLIFEWRCHSVMIFVGAGS